MNRFKDIKLYGVKSDILYCMACVGYRVGVSERPTGKCVRSKLTSRDIMKCKVAYSPIDEVRRYDPHKHSGGNEMNNSYFDNSFHGIVATTHECSIKDICNKSCHNCYVMMSFIE